MRTRRRSGAAGCSAACSAEVGTVVSEQLRAYLTAAALGAAGVSGLELAVGAVCRRLLHIAVWDYADEWGNLAGLVCPRYTFYWFLLCGWVVFVLRGVESTVYHPQKSVQKS